MTRFSSTFSYLSLLSCVTTVVLASSKGFPNGKIYGVNLGSWLVLEAWMLPQEWLDMGGESCSDCTTCISSEFTFAKAYPDTVDEIFNTHWSTWFTQDDVDKIASYGLNTVRIPLGYWIVEPLVNRPTETYPRGGIKQLKRGLKQLKEAGIAAILDHHALPGVQTANQQFTGNCTSDVQFYTDENYHRALVWTAVMTALSHLDADFGSVFAIEAVNEPIMDAAQTPGYGDFQQNFVKVVRAVEGSLGIGSSGSKSSGLLSGILSKLNATASILDAALEGGAVGEALLDAAPILAEVALELGIDIIIGGGAPSRTPLVTTFMDVNWQYDDPSNPAAAAEGSQLYDNHLYYSYGGVADATEDAYMESICNLNRTQADAALGDSPLVFGEWGLPTQWTPSDAFLVEWADAQKRAYSVGAGWIFWNFKVEQSTLAGDLGQTWSYFEGVESGYLTKDPSKMNNPNVCDPYIS
ncbi:hypothetical protein M0805_003952 [Coniferiporia weirii]|nr:hypothetical protein M0805_003952 [Coniferiporia weirii]